MHIIISSKPGQLGNSLFLFSHFIGFAIENNYKLINPAFRPYSGCFEQDNLKSTVASNSTFSYRAAYYSSRIIHRLKINNRFIKCIYIDWDESFNLCSPGESFNSTCVFVQGWKYRCTELVQKYSDEIKKYFSPAPSHRERIEKLISTAKETCDLLVGIHIRHGDYKKFEGGKYYYNLSQYRQVLQKMVELFQDKKIGFLVCSNQSQDLTVFKDFNTFNGSGHEVEDMYAFAQCDYLAGPPSTYTMWASFYGNVPLYMIHNPEANFYLSDFKVMTG